MRRSSRLGPRPLSDIAEAGRLCFSRRGYRLTQMSDVGVELNMSPSAAYRYVESKEALFHISALHAAGDSLEGLDLPVVVGDLAETVRSIEAVVRSWPRWPRLREALTRETASPGVDVEARIVAAELYDVLAGHWRLIVLLDRTAQDIPALRIAFMDGYRAPYLADIVTWFARRSGPAVEGAALEATARSGVEAISWLAMRRRADPAAEAVTDEASRQAARRTMAALLREAREPSPEGSPED